MEEKRKSTRLNLESKILLKRLDVPNSEETQIDIAVKDVSKTGMGFSCDYSLSIGSVYECLLTIWTKETIHAFVEIVRVVRKQNSFEYGGIFIGMAQTDTQRIEIYSTFCENEKNLK